MHVDYFNVEHNSKTHNCYLNHLGEVWIIEPDGSETSSSRFRYFITRIEDAKRSAIEILKMFGR